MKISGIVNLPGLASCNRGAVGRLRHHATANADHLRAGVHAVREGHADGAGLRVRQTAP